jgi:hypothetical protein
MKRLRAVLMSHAQGIQLGESAPHPLAVERLSEELRSVGRANEHYFALCVVMILALFLAALWVIIRYAATPDAVRGAFVCFGLSVAALIRVMIGLWREKVATELAVALVGALDQETTRSIIEVLLKRLR